MRTGALLQGRSILGRSVAARQRTLRRPRRSGASSLRAVNEEPGSDRGEPIEGLGGPDLMGSLARWAAEASADEAARARASERWIRQQAAEETTFASVLVDLAERHVNVMIQTTSGHRHRGSVRALGQDFVAVVDGRRESVIALRSVVSVRTQPRDAAAHSGRAVVLDLRLAEVIFAMAEDRPRVQVVTDADTSSGELRSVGRDVITIRADGSRANVYIPLDAVSEITVAEP